MSKLVQINAWDALRVFTDARIALGRTGASLPTQELLKFGLAHAQARDAVHQPFNSDQLADTLQIEGWQTLTVHSAAADRSIFLRRPDLGRKLSLASREALQSLALKPADLLLVIGDGLSSKAVHRQALPFLQALRPYLNRLDISVAPVVLAHQARVALGMILVNACGRKPLRSSSASGQGCPRRTASVFTSPGGHILAGWSLSATAFPIFAQKGWIILRLRSRWPGCWSRHISGV